MSDETRTSSWGCGWGKHLQTYEQVFVYFPVFYDPRLFGVGPLPLVRELFFMARLSFVVGFLFCVHAWRHWLGRRTATLPHHCSHYCSTLVYLRIYIRVYASHARRYCRALGIPQCDYPSIASMSSSLPSRRPSISLCLGVRLFVCGGNHRSSWRYPEPSIYGLRTLCA